MDADQGEEVAGLAVAGPEDLVVPVGVFPARGPRRVEPGQGRDEPGLQPLALLVEQLAGLVDVQLLDELPERAAEDQPGRDQADRQDAGPRSAIPWSNPRPLPWFGERSASL